VSPLVSRHGASDRGLGGGRLPATLVAVIGVLVVAVAVAGLAAQAVRGNRTVSVQRDARTTHDAALDDAFYHCIAVQAHSLVSPGQPVLLVDDLADLITLLKGVGSWVTIANPPSTAVASLSLQNGVRGGGACLGTQVIARTPHARRGAPIRIGSGASVPGHGPPPAPPL
jgi:hypothetical protein